MSMMENEGAPPTSQPEILDQAVEQIDRFTEANSNLRKLLQTVRDNPSDNNLQAATEGCTLVRISCTPFFEAQFYRETKSWILISSAVGAVMHETEEHWKLASELYPNDPTDLNFEDDFRDKALTALLPHDEFAEEDQETLDGRAGYLTGFICNIHQKAVDNLLDKFMRSDNVLDYAFRGVSREQRKEKMVHAGIVALAAFAGTTLAHIFLGKRKK